MKIRNLYEIGGQAGHNNTVTAWTFFHEEDFLSNIVFFNDNIIEPGVKLESHTHSSIEEVFYILEGTGVIECGEQKQHVQAGDAIYLPPKRRHSLANTSRFPLRFVCVGSKVTEESQQKKSSTA